MTSFTKQMYWKLKIYLGHGMGNLLYLIKAIHKALMDMACDFYLKEAR